MIQLSNASDKAVRAQIAESISLVAKSDFPDKWPDLVDVSAFVSVLLRRQYSPFAAARLHSTIAGLFLVAVGTLLAPSALFCCLRDVCDVILGCFVPQASAQRCCRKGDDCYSVTCRFSLCRHGTTLHEITVLIIVMLSSEARGIAFRVQLRSQRRRT